jgi:hypothetical protein
MSRRQATVFDNAAAFEFLHADGAWTEAAFLKGSPQTHRGNARVTFWPSLQIST